MQNSTKNSAISTLTNDEIDLVSGGCPFAAFVGGIVIGVGLARIALR